MRMIGLLCILTAAALAAGCSRSSSGTGKTAPATPTDHAQHCQQIADEITRLIATATDTDHLKPAEDMYRAVASEDREGVDKALVEYLFKSDGLMEWYCVGKRFGLLTREVFLRACREGSPVVFETCLDTCVQMRKANPMDVPAALEIFEKRWSGPTWDPELARSFCETFTVRDDFGRLKLAPQDRQRLLEMLIITLESTNEHARSAAVSALWRAFDMKQAKALNQGDIERIFRSEPAQIDAELARWVRGHKEQLLALPAPPPFKGMPMPTGMLGPTAVPPMVMPGAGAPGGPPTPYPSGLYPGAPPLPGPMPTSGGATAPPGYFGSGLREPMPILDDAPQTQPDH